MSPAALKRALDPAYIGSPFAQPFQFFAGDATTPMDLTGRAVVLFLDRQGLPDAHHEITGAIQTDGRVLFSVADTSAWIKGDYSLEVRLDGASVVVGRIAVAKGAGANGSDIVGAAQPPTAPGVVIAGSGVVQVVSVAPSATTDPSGIILPPDLSDALGGAETLADALLWLAQNGGTPSPILRDLIGNVVISSLATGALSVAAPAPVLLSGALSGSSALAGALSVTRALSGQVSGSGALTAALTVEREGLSGSVIAAGLLTGSLEVTRTLVGAVEGSAAVVGALSVERALSGAVYGMGAVTGDLTVEETGPVAQRVIWDTDQDSDIDDVIATAVLQALEETGEAVLIATTLATKNNYAPDAMRKFLNFSGRTTVPVGSHQGVGSLGGPDTSPYATQVADLLPPAKIARASYPTALSVLTDALTASPDGSVKIIVGGTCTNIAALLASPGGAALVAAKVASIHVMGGWFNGSTAEENNILFDVAAANTVASTSPVPVYWAGAEVGGPVLTRMSPGYSTATNPYALAWNLYAVASRPSWDTVPVLDAIRGVIPALYTHSAPGNVSFDGASVSTFTADAGGKNRFLIRADTSSGGDVTFADYINALVDQFMAAHDTPALYLLGEYKMEEGTGQVLVDSSPFARNGTLGSSASVEATDPTWDANGLAFNADTAVVLNSPDFESRTFTYCYVVRPDNITGIKVISARDSSSLASRAEQIRMNAGKLELVLRYDATAAVPVSATVNFAVGQWALVTVRVAADRRTYMGRVNGLEVISGVLPADLSPGSFQNFCLGSRATGTAVSDGMIGVIRYAAASVALSDSDVAALETRARAFATSKGITLP